jgi:6-pyruvoyl-tetrahydropterin synthase
MNEKNKLPSTDTEDFEFLVDHFDPAKQEKKIAEDIINTIVDDASKDIPLKFTITRIQESYKLKEVPMLSLENSLWHQFTKDEKISQSIQGYRTTVINGKSIRIPYVAFGADLDYLDEMIRRIITRINNLKEK